MYDTKIYAYEFIPSHKKRDPKVSFEEYSVFRKLNRWLEQSEQQECFQQQQDQ
jgi:hypothetical protein